jgi:putative hydrolase of the HAD superfamily
VFSVGGIQSSVTVPVEGLLDGTGVVPVGGTVPVAGVVVDAAVWLDVGVVLDTGAAPCVVLATTFVAVVSTVLGVPVPELRSTKPTLGETTLEVESEAADAVPELLDPSLAPQAARPNARRLHSTTLRMSERTKKADLFIDHYPGYVEHTRQGSDTSRAHDRSGRRLRSDNGSHCWVAGNPAISRLLQLETGGFASPPYDGFALALRPVDPTGKTAAIVWSNRQLDVATGKKELVLSFATPEVRDRAQCASAAARLRPMCSARRGHKFFYDLFILCGTYRNWRGPQMVKNVIFDLGGVVIEWNPERILAGYYADPQMRAIMKTELFQHPDWLQLDRGTLNEADLLVRLAGRTGRPAAELSGLLDAVRGSLHTKTETVALLERLFARGVPLYCLSNMSSDMFAYLRERHSFWGVFRGIVISGDIKMMKPEREIFEFLLQRYGLVAAESVFVDDNAPNIEAARELGIHPVWFKDAGQCERELEKLLASS